MKKKETLLGIKIYGDWHEVSVESEKVAELLREYLGEDRIREFDDWRPRQEVDLCGVQDKTVEKNVLNEHQAEQNLQKEAQEGLDEIKNGKTRKGSKRLFGTINAFLRRIIRPIESFIYRHIITRFNPYFFESEEVDSCLQRKGKDYEIEVSVDDDEAREGLKKEVLEKEDREK